jgi:hypothetical protein
LYYNNPLVMGKEMAQTCPKGKSDERVKLNGNVEPPQNVQLLRSSERQEAGEAWQAEKLYVRLM